MAAADRRRSDARRNHERVVQAAVDVFAELGLAATVPDVAARAGVGKATVYRNFPSREDLLSAVVAYQLRWFRNLATSTLADPDPRCGFERLIDGWFERIMSNQLAQDFLRPDALPGMRDCGAEVTEIVDQVVVRAQKAGMARVASARATCAR
ncbi:Transcriptional regulator, TetR family (fragment) [Frankia canadensis]|uniref:Transcriptional regulator, TetR family n=1 Tax=Frankia canadensis TaxID=1836972 RepID=A0A2I2KVQ0_9ACTN